MRNPVEYRYGGNHGHAPTGTINSYYSYSYNDLYFPQANQWESSQQHE